MNISIVMATYNGEKYLKEQLDSICSQLDSTDEIIICDDGSSDRTVQLIHEYTSENGLQNIIKLFVNEKNMGFANNFNKALSLATKEYIFFSDQDDIWEKEKLNKMMSVFKEHEDCKLLCCDYSPFYSSSEAPKIPGKALKRMPDNNVVEKISISKQSIYIGQLGCCMGMKREFREEIKSLWFDGWAQDDRCWRLALCYHGLYVLHSNLVQHRLHDSNTATFGKYHTIEKRVRLFQSMRQADEQMLKCIDSEKEMKVVRKNAKMFDYRIALLEKKKIVNIFILLKYLCYYQTKKSYLVELFLVMKGR